MQKLISIVVTLVVVTGLAGCGDDGPETVSAGGDRASTGTVAVHIEDVEGPFIEGFEVGLRFEDAEGTVLASTLWSDFVLSQGDPQLDDFYVSVLEQEVPAGKVVVLASANVGMGPAPEVPDVNGDLRCRLEVDVPDSGRVDVEVTFDAQDRCLRLM